MIQQKTPPIHPPRGSFKARQSVSLATGHLPDKKKPPGVLHPAALPVSKRKSNRMTYFTSLFCSAMATASVRLATPSLERMLET